MTKEKAAMTKEKAAMTKEKAAMMKGNPRRQRGISMFVVLMVVLLALVLVLGGLSAGSLNEALVGNQSDAQRAYGAAQALLDTAQRDILLNGLGCDAIGLNASGGNANFKAGTPPVSAKCTLRFPRNTDDYNEMAGGSAPGRGHCASGVCISSSPADPLFEGDTIDSGNNAQQWDNGAGYDNSAITVLDGSGATAYGGTAKVGSVFLSEAIQGRYWVEIFPYNTNSVAIEGVGNAPVPSAAYPFIFRITAKARGLKDGTTAVLRSYYTPFPMRKS